LKADSMCNIYSEKCFPFRGRYCLNMIVSGKEGSRFGFAINVWNEENGRRIWKLHTILPVQTIPKENQKYVCSFSIPPELYEGYDVFTPYIVIHEGDINVYKYYVTKQ